MSNAQEYKSEYLQNMQKHTESQMLGSAPAFRSNLMKLVKPPCSVATIRGDVTAPFPLTSAPACKM